MTLPISTQPAEAHSYPDFKTMKPLQIIAWIKENPLVEPGWGENLRAKLSQARDHAAELEEQRDQTQNTAEQS